MADPIFDPSLPSTDFAAAPAFDPNLPSEDVAEVPTFNPTEVSENQYSLADIKATTPQALAEDKDFAPIRFSVANEKALQQDPDAQNKVIEAYRIKEARGSTLLEKGKKAATGFIPALTRLVKGAAGAISTPQDIFLRQAKAITEGKGIEEAKKSVAEIAAIPASLESNVASYLDLGKGFVRAGAETVTGATRAVVGPGTITEAISSLGKGQLTPEEFRARYFSDLGSAKVATEAAQGQGPALQALGLDAENLAPLGIVVDPVKIEEFSILTDPLNFVPIGAAVGIVGKTGRAIGKNIIARTATEAQAAALSKFMNEAKRVASATSATAQGGVGAGIEAVGDFITRAGAATQRNFRRAGAGVIGAGVGAILGRDIYSALGGLAITKGVPFATKVAGKSMSKVGRMVSGVDAVPAPAAFAGEAFKQGAIGTAEGAVLTAPFVIGSRTEDEEALLGMIPIAGVARAATLAPAGTRAIGEAAQNKLASEIFRTVEQAPAPAMAAYGTEPTLDTTHAETVSKLDPQEQNFVNLFRSKFEGSPIEIYAVDRKTMEHRTGNESAAGFAIEAGQRTNPDGTNSPVFRILLNESSSALPHEAYHAFEFLEPTRAREFEKTVADNLTPQQLENFGDTYNAALNAGKPEAQWNRLTDQGIAREVAAEAFSRIILGQDLSGVPPSVRRQASLFASGLLEKLGTPLARTGAAPAVGGSIIGGVRAGTSSVKLGQDWIAGLFDRIEQQGELLPTKTPEEPFTGTMEQLPVDLSARVPEAPAAPPVRPTQLQLPLSERVPPVQPAPIVEAAAPITPEAQRATVIGAPEALAAAAKLGPEVIARVNELVGYIESGKPVLEIEHSGVKSAGTPEAPLGRTARRAEQEAPDFVREIYEKGVVPDRLVVVGGKPQLLAMSLDKVVTNLNRAVKDAATYKVEGLIPYESAEGKLTDAGWREATADLTIYTRNQANGFQGGGDPLVRPATDLGLSIPAETPGYVPTKLSPERADFQNLIQGLATPLTAREVKGQIPGNVKGQVLAEANLRGLEIPAAIRPENITKQQFKSVSRRLMEVNPLRNKLAEAGVPVRELEDVTERINVQNIVSMTPRPDLQFNAPVTDIIRGGFSPKELRSRIQEAEIFASKSEGEIRRIAQQNLLDLYDEARQARRSGVTQEELKILADRIREMERYANRSGEQLKREARRDLEILYDREREERRSFSPKVEDDSTFTARLNEAQRLTIIPKNQIRDELYLKVYALEKQEREARKTPGQEEVAKSLQDTIKESKNFLLKSSDDVLYFKVRDDADALRQEARDRRTLPKKASGDFSPTPLESTADYGRRILEMDDTTFTSTMNASKGGLTGLAYDVGLALKDKNDLTILKGLAETANAAAQTAMANKDFAGAMPLIMRGQFFREALEAATNTGSAATMLPRLRPGETSPFSAGDFQPESKPEPEPEPEPARPNPHAKGSYNYYVEEKRRQKPNPYAKGSYNYSIEEKRRQGIIIPGQFSPKPGEELSPIKTAAIRTPGGEIFTGAWHGEAAMKLAEAIGKGELKEPISKEARIEAEFMGEDTGFGEDGFVSESGEFLNREQAFERAREIKQIGESFPGALLEAGAFERRRAFAPKIMRDAQGRPLTRDGLVDFEKLYKELAKEREVAQSRTINEAKYAVAPAKSRESSLTGWILPSGDFTDLKGSSVHEDYLASNADALNKRFGTNFPKTPDVDERLAALNKGFVRMRLDRTGNGEEHVEINKRFWNPRNRRTIEARLQDNASEISSVRVNLLNDAGNVVDSNVIRLADLADDVTPESAIADGLRELRGSAAPFPLAKEVTGRLKQLADNGNVTREFWINSKNGEILFAPDGHEEAAMEFFSPDSLAARLHHTDEMYRQKFLRGIRTDGAIHLNSGGPEFNLSRQAKETLAVLSDSYNNSSVFLDDVNLRINAEPPGDFSPAEVNLPGLKLPSEERAAQIVTRRKITKAKERFPEAIVPQFQKNTEGNFIIGDDGKPKPVAIDYDLADSPVGRSAAKGIRGDEARDDAVASALAAGIVATYKKAVKNPDIKAGEKWYSTARARLRKIFGEDSKFVTELIAATSARTPVDTNYRFALDAYNSFREGGYDALLKTYNEGKQKWETRDLADFIEDTGNQNPTRGQFIDWWVEKHDLLPRQSNGKKFGMNSRAVLRVLDGTWREEVKGPKTPNFAGNLSGDTFAATIDVWAARLLHRLANVGNSGRWRILPQNETGVTDADFNLGQAAFNKASEELEIKADALQAILWFAEKDLHEKNGWTSGAGAAKSDFNTLLSETETLPTGRKKMRSAQKELKL